MKHSFLLLATCLLFAMHLSAKDYKLYGQIRFNDSGQTASEVHVYAMTTDSLIRNHLITNKSGVFMWKGLPPDMYIFYVQVKGYQPINMLIDWKNNKNIDLGKLLLIPHLTDKEIELPEVVVKGNQVIQKADKMIVFPQVDQIKISAGSMDLLRVMNLPGMNVNSIEQRVLIEGQTPVYQINGRPQSREQVLGIKPDDIARIEYSNNPSIRYANQNVGGVINFILKERYTGGSVYANAMASPMTGFLNGTLSSGFNYKKSEFTFLYNNSWRDYDKRWTNRSEEFNGSDYTIKRYSNGLHSPFGYLSHNINLGYTLQLNDKDMFSVMFLNDVGRQHTSINANMQQLAGNDALEFTRRSKAVYNGYFPSLDLFFIHKFKDQSLEFNLVGTLGNGDYKRNLSDYYSDSQEEKIVNNVDNHKRSLIGEATYRRYFKTQSLSLGIRHIQSYTKNEYTGANTEIAEMNSMNTYIYGEWSGRLKKLSYSLGTGVKFYKVDNKSEKKDYVSNLSTVSLLYPLSKKLKVSYLLQLTPTLPTLSQLSDIEQTYDDLLTIKGNPQLKKYNSLRNRFLFTYTNKKFRANLWLSHTKTFSPIALYTFYDNERFISEYQNMNYNQQTNAQLDMNLSNLLNCINLSVTGGWNRYSSSGTDYHHHLYNLYWSTSMQVYYKNWNLSCEYTRPQKRLSGEILSTDENYSAALLGYKHGNFMFRGGVYYPFTQAWKSQNSSLSKANPYHEKVYIKDNRNMIMVGITYQFSYGKSFNKSRKTLSNSDSETGILKVQE